MRDRMFEKIELKLRIKNMKKYTEIKGGLN